MLIDIALLILRFTVEKNFFYSKFDYKNKESKKVHKQQQQR